MQVDYVSDSTKPQSVSLAVTIKGLGLEMWQAHPRNMPWAAQHQPGAEALKRDELYLLKHVPYTLLMLALLHLQPSNNGAS